MGYYRHRYAAALARATALSTSGPHRLGGGRPPEALRTDAPLSRTVAPPFLLIGPLAPEPDAHGQRWALGRCRDCGQSGVLVRYTPLAKAIRVPGRSKTLTTTAYACAGCVPEVGG